MVTSESANSFQNMDAESSSRSSSHAKNTAGSDGSGGDHVPDFVNGKHQPDGDNNNPLGIGRLITIIYVTV